MGKVFRETAQIDLLYLALLFHDIGKSERKDHVPHGVRMTDEAVQRWGLDGHERNLLILLVREHLMMAHLSQRRDLDDDALIAGFAKRFPDLNSLRMLYLLTYADMSALARGVWDRWKGMLLWELYAKTAEKLSAEGEIVASAANRAAEAAERIVTALSARFAPDPVRGHLRMLPPRYTLLNEPADVEEHLRLIEALAYHPAALSFIERGELWEIVVCTRDKPYRLSEICGVLSANDLNIFRAQVYTRSDDVVLDLFHVTGVSGESGIAPRRQARIQAQLSAVLQGGESVQRLFEEHQARWSRRRRPGRGGSETCPSALVRVAFENHISGRYTVIDVFAPDSVGLLYRITRTLSDLGLNIHTARIATEVDQAVDSFYVSDARGHKIYHPEQLRAIEFALIERIG